MKLFRPCLPFATGAVLAVAGIVPCASSATEPSPEGLAFFEKNIRPLLIERCYECHGEDKQKGGLRLDSQPAVLTGGDTGPALVAGKPDASLLLKAVSYTDPNLKMPPKEKLGAHQVALLKQWIEMGAPDPRTNAVVKLAKAGIDLEAGRQFWAFQPVRPPALPAVRNTAWPRSDLDRFILARLEEKGIGPSPDADRPTLIRRVYFDLIGLPPSPQQIDAFVNDRRPDAYARVVDELLGSPHFGERWGRHWLDLARYAESSGGGRTLLFPEAWRYRDYVVDSFNQDKPFDRFVREQIAGDLLPHASPEQRREQLTATAYLALGPTNYERQDKDILELDVIDEQLDLIGKGLLGMTIGCARCHDHKFDPIPTKDYYALAGIFKSTQTMIHDNVSRWVDNELPVKPEVEIALKEHAAAVTALQDQIKTAKKATADTSPAPKGPVAPSSLPGIVMDDPKGKAVGEWTHSTFSKNYVGEGYLHDGNKDKGQKTITFTPEIPKTGRYEVRLAWVPASNRASNTPVSLLHLDGEVNLTVNQRETPPIGDRFISLGQFRFDTSGQWFVLISNEDTDGHVIVDAVQFIPLDDAEAVKLAGVAKLPMPTEVDRPEMIPFIVPDPKSLPGIVVDDTDAELVGEWKYSVHTPPFVGGSYVHDDKTGKGEKSATFRPSLPVAGDYEVRLAHNYNIRRATNAPITIKHATGEARVVVNQQDEPPHGRLFRTLGTFRFDAGTSGFVKITTEGTDGKNVIVDAVQFLPVGDTARALAEEKPAVDVKKLEAQLKELQNKGPKRPVAMGVREGEKIGDFYVCIRGLPANKGPDVPRGFLQVATVGKAPPVPKDHSGRLELADWIASPDNPLTARVFVNRAWHWLTGGGLVRSTDNFGATGEKPSHPELLDWLAARFMAEGWSVKKLAREIVLSRTYQQQSAAGILPAGLTDAKTEDSRTASRLLAAQSVDPENRLHWRMNRRRMRAEAVRDTILVASGQLNRELGGSTIKPGTTIEYGYKFDDTRRSLYTPVFRNTLLEIFESFDFPDPNMVVGRRNISTTATQGLFLMNHPFVIEQSRAAAKVALAWPDMDDAQRLERAYRITLGRRPTERELQLAMDFVTIPTEENATPGRRLDAWAQFYQTLFASVDFRYLN
jgi:hypothetical protein